METLENVTLMRLLMNLWACANLEIFECPLAICLYNVQIFASAINTIHIDSRVENKRSPCFDASVLP